MKSILRLSLISFCLLINCADKKKDKSVSDITSKDCIDLILKQDDSLGSIRNHNCETISLNETIRQYVNSINNLNYENCPDKFEKAFKNHADAWSKMGEFSKQYSNLRGEMHDLFDSIEKTSDSTTFKPLLKEIWDTWADVETTKAPK